MSVGEIRIERFDYPLPDERIARHPLQQRDACRMVVSRSDGELEHRRFSDLPEMLDADTLMVCNNTRVINARIKFRKESGAQIEVFLLEPVSPEDYALMFASSGPCRWSCMVGNLKRWKDAPLSKSVEIDGKCVTLTARRLAACEGNAHVVEFSWDAPVTFAEIVEAAGYIPIPPYLRRDGEASDADDYQTVYSRISGSVAAPTAGLHFTPAVMAALRKKGVKIEELTLHVGAGTFQPVKSDTIGEHPMHTEVFSVSRALLTDLIAALEVGNTVCAVGTTTVRTLESLPYLGAAVARGETDLHVNQWDPYQVEAKEIDTVSGLRALAKYMDDCGEEQLTASTAIMIAPGFRWRIVGRMVTNFHQPQSTLLLLVSSFLNPDGDPESDTLQWRRIYDCALAMDYRFLSYGDACLLSPVKI